jgi:hypothetical protein
MVRIYTVKLYCKLYGKLCGYVSVVKEQTKDRTWVERRGVPHVLIPTTTDGSKSQKKVKNKSFSYNMKERKEIIHRTET